MLLKALITEKSSKDAKNGLFTFMVGLFDTKTTIKQMVEKTFAVKVNKVRTMIMHGKDYRTGKRGRHAVRSDWKKAIVSLDKTQKIDLWP